MNLGIYQIGDIRKKRLDYLNKSLLDLFNTIQPNILTTSVQTMNSQPFIQKECVVIGDEFLYYGDAVQAYKLLDWFLQQKTLDCYLGLVSKDMPLIGTHTCRTKPTQEEFQDYPELKEGLQEGFVRAFHNLGGLAYLGKRVSMASLMWDYTVHPHPQSYEEQLKQNEVRVKQEVLHSFGLKHHSGKGIDIREFFMKNMLDLCVMGWEDDVSKSKGYTSTTRLCEEHTEELKKILNNL
jgi:hypothetical protein